MLKKYIDFLDDFLRSFFQIVGEFWSQKLRKNSENNVDMNFADQKSI